MNPDKTYLLINKDTGDSIRKTGKELSEGFDTDIGRTEKQYDNPDIKVICPNQYMIWLSGEKTDAVLQAIGAEFDPHFLSQNVTRNDGAKEKGLEEYHRKANQGYGYSSSPCNGIAAMV